MAIDGQISGLLQRRSRLLEELAAVDRKLRALSAESSDHAGSSRVRADLRWFPVRGEEVAAERYEAPSELDRDDLRRRLGKIVVDERRRGRPLDGLEILVAYQPEGGRVIAVRSRRPGDASWVRRFEALGAGEGH